MKTNNFIKSALLLTLSLMLLPFTSCDPTEPELKGEELIPSIAFSWSESSPGEFYVAMYTTGISVSTESGEVSGDGDVLSIYFTCDPNTENFPLKGTYQFISFEEYIVKNSSELRFKAAGGVADASTFNHIDEAEDYMIEITSGTMEIDRDVNGIIMDIKVKSKNGLEKHYSYSGPLNIIDMDLELY